MFYCPCLTSKDKGSFEKCTVDFFRHKYISRVMKKVLYQTKQRFILETRDGIAHSYDHCKTCLINFSGWGLILMQAFRYQAIYIIATTDLKVPRSYFVKKMWVKWVKSSSFSVKSVVFKFNLLPRAGICREGYYIINLANFL